MELEFIKIDVSGQYSPVVEVDTGKPDRVWRWSLTTQPPEDVVPVHGRNAQIEDEGNDWRWLGDNQFKYGGVGHTADHVWLILQYNIDQIFDCPECGTELPTKARFCSHCGSKI